MMRYLILAAVALLLTGCGILSPETQRSALEALEGMLEAKAITYEQFVVLRDALLAGGSSAWWTQLAEIGAAAGLAYLGVEIRRGKPTQRFGLPEEKVIHKPKGK